ncbi:MAG: biotin/lipoyl-binding protein, partial [Candidatus Latescibacteria bacterium]|nr:biotin/lipoyl-binding protein [Candidatus Latescibacterota bacterium]
MRPYPELRQDLVISEQDQAGKKIYVVKAPVSGKFFRFVAFQYYVATLLDGNTSLAALQDIVSERLRRPVRVKTLETFVHRLHEYGLLEPYEWTSDFTILPADGVTASTQLSDRKSILFYTLPLIDPHRLFDRLYPWCSFCFTKPFVFFSGFWVLLAAWGLMTDWDMYTTQLYAFDPDLSSILSVYLFLVLTLTVHELAHGMACRHYGGRVSKMGFLMLYFQFGAYTDVSDSYLFPKKSSRMVVMLAGMITGILIIATTALLWRVTDETTWVHHTSFIIMAVTGWGVFFNLNPLIKLDGYYILSDWLDIPNLRHKAFKYLKARARQLFGLYTPAGIATTVRERRIYLSYGTLAAAYSVVLITIITSLISDFVIEYAPEIGVIGLMIGIVAMAVQAPVGDPPQENQKATPVPSVDAKKRTYTFRLIVWIGVLIVLIAASLLIEIELRISSPFQLRSRERAVVRSRIDGQLNQIFVGEGDTVAVGQLIAKLDTRSIDSELRTVAAQIDQARAR